MAGHIEDYALIGDLHTAALVGRDGSVDWLCLPRFDSPAVAASLLGSSEHGHWTIAPADPGDPAPGRGTDRRFYRGDTLVLESRWETPHGSVRVIDFMPPRHLAGGAVPRLIRLVEGETGSVRMRSRLRPRFHYGRITPWVTSVDQPFGTRRVRMTAGPRELWLDSSVETTITEDRSVLTDFTVCTGERAAFVLTEQASHLPAPPLPDPQRALEATETFWTEWTRHCTYTGPARAAVIRSLITLKALTYAPTGGIVAAPTTSLPEEIGGVRNWDYRFTWLRDAAITLSSLLRTGYREEARAWREWLLRAVAGDPENLQIMYGIAGERELGEAELTWLPGYESSRPVRVGNAAADQLQLDVYGEVAETLHLTRRPGADAYDEAARLQLHLTHHLEQRWQEPDEGIWEIRGPRRHFVHSKVMAWVAVDRAIQLIESGGADGPVERWRRLRETIHRDVCDNGYDPARNTFTQSYGSTELDASLLLIPRTGFLPPDDKRVLGTIDAIQRELSTPEGLVRRYPTHGEQHGLDGLAGDEGAFLVCSFWMVDALALAGRLTEAETLFNELLHLRSDLGLLAEEWDTRQQRQVGNYPQAFSHVGIVDSALLLAELTTTRHTTSITTTSGRCGNAQAITPTAEPAVP
ncbi:glycoside hydrolase family 15 protein [Streptomyces mobaraensis]|uniref:Trehalase n=1 Tax=Streptomyces mobaraensis TaxID=35621 RepID=A0A5N5W2Z9_STRMB|nr:glycoside hydrolase family 15 protein [Streptomyces mobaraensis]